MLRTTIGWLVAVAITGIAVLAAAIYTSHRPKVLEVKHTNQTAPAPATVSPMPAPSSDTQSQTNTQQQSQNQSSQNSGQSWYSHTGSMSSSSYSDVNGVQHGSESHWTYQPDGWQQDVNRQW